MKVVNILGDYCFNRPIAFECSNCLMRGVGLSLTRRKQERLEPAVKTIRMELNAVAEATSMGSFFCHRPVFVLRNQGYRMELKYPRR